MLVQEKLLVRCLLNVEFVVLDFLRQFLETALVFDGAERVYRLR